ncbi:MAG: hypothetical protein R3D57_01120 [Hyphomicrobiaceae bacterium]
MILRAAGAVLILVGLALLAFDFVSADVAPEPHPKHVAKKTHKSGLPVIEAMVAERQLDEISGEAITPERLEDITLIFASAIVRYWPKAGESDLEVLRSFRENWLLAVMQRASIWKTWNGVARPPGELAYYERRDYRMALAKGVGICSQAALAIADYLRERKVPVLIAGLDGHVVAVAELQGRSFIVDADYGVVLPMSMTEVEADPTRIREAYLARGYPRSTVERLERIFGSAGNKLVAPDGYAATSASRLKLFDIGVWLIPSALVLAGLLLLGRAHNHKSVRTSTPKATR